MFYQSQRMKLRCVRIVKKSRTNDIVICEDLNTSARNLYTLLAIKEHQTVKTYLEVFEQAHLTAQDSYIDSFSDQGAFCMVFGLTAAWEAKSRTEGSLLPGGYVPDKMECCMISINCIKMGLSEFKFHGMSPLLSGCRLFFLCFRVHGCLWAAISALLY